MVCAGDLLGSTGNLVDKLLDVDDELCKSWSKPDFVQALLEATKQVGYEQHKLNFLSKSISVFLQGASVKCLDPFSLEPAGGVCVCAMVTCNADSAARWVSCPDSADEFHFMTFLTGARPHSIVIFVRFKTKHQSCLGKAFCIFWTQRKFARLGDWYLENKALLVVSCRARRPKAFIVAGAL